MKTKAVRVAALLGISGLAAAVAMQNDPPAPRPGVSAAPARNQPRAGTTAPKITPVDPAALVRPEVEEIKDNIFAIPPPPPPPTPPPKRVEGPPPPPPAPTAPPLPFRFIGRLIDNGSTTIFIAQNDRSFAVRQGDTVADVYKVEQLTPSEIVFIYLPLAERQVLQIGAAN